MDDTTLKMKDPPTKRVNEEDQTDDKKPAAKENVQDERRGGIRSCLCIGTPPAFCQN
jgi:hypothetical protein